MELLHHDGLIPGVLLERAPCPELRLILGNDAVIRTYRMDAELIIRIGMQILRPCFSYKRTFYDICPDRDIDALALLDFFFNK